MLSWSRDRRSVSRLRISLRRGPAVAVSRISLGRLKLAYVICADKKIRYKGGRSYIAYIGTTERGIDRVAQSAATRADEVLSLRGIKNFNVHVVTCTPR